MLATLGFFASLLIGLVLGLVGGGGSILTVPVLAYLFGLPGREATGASLFIVGISALVGSIGSVWRKEVSLGHTFLFAIPSALSVFSVRRFVVPALPEQIGTIGKDQFLLIVFAILMLTVSFFMIRKTTPSTANVRQRVWLIPIIGIAVGFVAGFVGAGGGFLIVPALVLLMDMDMRQAVPTSLSIIAFQSLVGFTGELGQHTPIKWSVVLAVALIATVGIFIGQFLKNKANSDHLKPAFGWFVLVIGTLMVVKELFFGTV
ncbi:sulfite exporter TauE/SafE family protein [Kamptonema cortianum]|nr:sulfite exporter TauE/SafE family protein [Geitlerinema splendidum]MDK3160921.1 sulfite exporter TauE/SafE family protein [Kamptonema cortianum]